MPRWTPEQVASVAPDVASVVAARGLATPGWWSGTGHDDRAVWGRCRGYSAAVDLNGQGFSCSCPSRKVPCKHVLGLLLLWASQPEAAPRDVAPGPVEEWLATRAARATTRGATAEKRTPDPEARARRMADRAARIGAGLEELDLWLRDLVRQGLAAAQSRPFRYWDDVAARMVDAQAPGAGTQVRRMAGIVHSGDGWPGRLLVHAGRLHLLVEGWRRFDSLPPETQADLRTAVGWAWTADEVLARAPVRDRWGVVARSIVDEERFRVQRTWLVGGTSRRCALVLDFAAASGPLPADLVMGTVVDADLALYPGAFPQRALVAATHGEPEPLTRWDGAPRVEAALAEHAHALAANPWLDRLPVVLADVVPAARDERRWVRDAGGGLVRLVLDEAAWWTLVAVAGGHRVGVAGEWQDGALRPLAVWADGRLVALA